MAGTVSFTTVIVARIVLGAGEGPAFPLALHAVYKWFDNTRRTVPTSIVACGAAFGAIVDIATDPAAGFRTGFLIAGAFVAAGGVIAIVLAQPEVDLAARLRP